MSERDVYWRVMCQTNHHPGQWQSWFIEQCCAVGWPPPSRGNGFNGYEFDLSKPTVNKAWATARNALHEMQPGHFVVATLPNGRVGRVGEIVRLAATDGQWNPIVKASGEYPVGENGRRILVRWDLTRGPRDANMVTKLPAGLRDNGIAAVSRLTPRRYAEILEAMGSPENWEPLYGTFAAEAALSDYIAVHPYRLEDGMRTHAAAPKIREWAIAPGCRIDVMLQDADGRSVVVECKQGGASTLHLDQVCRYLVEIRARYPQWGEPRGVIVHGGSRHVAPELRDRARATQVEFIHHDLRVDFSSS